MYMLNVYGYLCTIITTTTTILRPFFWDHPGEPVPQKNFWTLWCKERLTEADTNHSAGHHSIRTNQCPPPPSPSQLSILVLTPQVSVSDGSGRGRNGRARVLHGGWRCTNGMVDELALHRKLLRPQLRASNGGVLVHVTHPYIHS